MTDKQVMQLTDQLLELLDQEKELLKKRDMKGVINLLEEKENLSSSYHYLLSQIEGNPEILQGNLEVLRNKIQKIKERVDENMSSLTIMAEANESVLKALVDGVTNQKERVSCYTTTGEVHSPRLKQTSGFSVDQCI